MATSIECERFPEIGGIIHLEHFNFEVLEHDLATAFFINGLGFTRDPYRRTDETNIGINIGLQQFHLPRRGKRTPPFIGEVGLIVPQIPIIKARLDRLDKLGKFDGSEYAIDDVNEDIMRVRTPYGVRLILHRAGSIPFLHPLGLTYVDIPVMPGKAEAVADFYRRVMGAPAEISLLDGEISAVVTFGAHQYVRYRERERDDYDLHDFHVACYVSNYNEIRDRVVEQGSLKGDGFGQIFFFDEIFDPDNGEMIVRFQQEIRSIYHPDFMRPLVNRWPMNDEPFTDLATVTREIVNMAG